MPGKILIVTECFYPEEFKVNDIALSWKDKGYDVDVLTLSPTYPIGKVFEGYGNSLFSRDRYKGVNIFRIHAVTGYNSSHAKKILKYVNFMCLGGVAALLIGKKYDYVFGFNIGALTSMLPAVLVRRLYRKPLTLWVQDVWPDSVYAYGFKKTKPLVFLLDKFVKFVYSSANHIAISSEGFALKLATYVRQGFVFNYLPNWADELDNSLNPINLGLEGRVNFTFAGNVGKVQNLENIIRAFNSLDKDYIHRAQLNIVGGGSALEHLKALDTHQNVIFYGKQPREDMARYYKSSDFLIVSLVDEPIFSVTVPAKIQTYIAAKKPILAIINGESKELVISHNLGLHSSPSDLDGIRHLFMRCIDMSPDEREAFTKDNDMLLKTVFNKQNTIDSLLELLRGGRA